jgi:flavin reductase (DIM6/NTAB) family NADH-FMN oxidoreductase RutF
MASVPTAVAVVSAKGIDGPAGATAAAVSSLSLDPPLILVCLDRGSRTLAAITVEARFAISFLGEASEDLARRFATKLPGEEKWLGVDVLDLDGIPALADAILALGCRLRDMHDGGDHVIATGEVLHVEGAGGAPLLYFDREFRRLGESDSAADERGP